MSSYTSEYIAKSILKRDSPVDQRQARVSKHRDASDYCLVDRLPPLSRLEQEALQQAALSEEQAILDAQVKEALDAVIQEDLFAVPEVPRSQSPPTFGRHRLPSLLQRTRSNSGSSPAGKVGPAPQRRERFEAHDVYRAIERKDLTTLFEIRDAAFPLLVQKTGGQTPLLYASRIGKSHREIAILLTGALSRFVNHLPDDAAHLTPQLQSLIRSVRTNLKLAINESLTTNQTELISSYLQIIIMSEGDKWVTNSTQSIALALRSGKSARPVATARAAVQAFATRELKTVEKGNAVASVEDYLANATNDLIMMAYWALIAEKLGGKLLPAYQFGRDDRIFKSFSDNIDVASKSPEYARQIPSHIRAQIKQVSRIMDARATGHSEKSRELAELLDQ